MLAYWVRNDSYFAIFGSSSLQEMEQGEIIYSTRKREMHGVHNNMMRQDGVYVYITPATVG